MNAMPQTNVTTFKKSNPDNRTQESLLAPIERKTLQWLAARLPRWVQPDQLSILGLIAMGLTGALFAMASVNKWFLLGVPLMLALNWFGDSLDGTLARYRNRQRPMYGFYVDHIIDAFGSTMLLGGLALSGFMQPFVAFALLILYLLLSIDAYLATYSTGKFRLSHWKMSPTELRILLSIGALQLLWKPEVGIGNFHGSLFDVGGLIGCAGLIVTLIKSISRTTLYLYNLEKLPPETHGLQREIGGAEETTF